jgi:type VI secretion system protein ImpL
MDRLPFFTEFVRNLTKEESQQVLGVTIPMRDMRAGGSYGDEQTSRLTADFERLFHSLADARPEFLGRETDITKQPAAYEFPREFRKIRPAMVQFLVDLCQPSELAVGPFLRGFYFTGVRPIVINEAAPFTSAPKSEPGYGLAPGATGVFKAGELPEAPRGAAPVAASRKVPQWLFLSHLFNNVLLADTAAMGASGSSVKTGTARRALFLAAAVVCLLLSIAFTVSFFKNRALETEARDAAIGISSTESSGQNLASLDALRKLEALRQSLETLVKYHRDGEPWSYRWGLYTGDDLYPEVRRIYFDRFRQLLFQQTQGAILANLRSLPLTQGPDYTPTYDALKAYLITTSNHDKSTKLFLSPVLTKWWAGNRSPDADRLALAQKQFDFYSTELKEENPFSKESDTLAVERARRYLKGFAGVERVYAFMLAEAGKSNPPIDYNRQFPGASQVVTQPHVVPGAFSKGGYTFMKDAIANADRYFNGEQWVLGDPVAGGNIDRAALPGNLRDRYHSDFAKQWRTYIKSAAVVRYGGLKDATEKLTQLSGGQSPLLELFSLASTNTAVDDPNVAKIFNSVQSVVAPGSTDRFIGPPNQSYMSALVTILTSLEAIPPGDITDAAAGPTLNNAAQARVVTRQMAQAFLNDGEGHIETNVQKLLEDPITYLDAMLKSVDVVALNGAGRSLCGDFRPILSKYPFKPDATSEATVADVNKLFHKPDGLLWAFFDQKLQKVLVRQGAQYVPNPTSKVTVNPEFLRFFNNAAAFGETIYVDGGADPHFSYSLKPETTEGVEMLTLRLDGQPPLVYKAGTPAAFRKFTWQGSGTHEALLSVRFGTQDLGLANGEGLWAAFHLFQLADTQSTASGGVQVLDWVAKTGRAGQPILLGSGKPLTVRVALDLGTAPPLFQRGYLSRMTCVADVAR